MSKGITGRLFKGDRIIWCVLFILCVLSLIEVFSASSWQTYNTNYWVPITRHAIFVFAGVFTAWFMHNMKLEWIKGMTKFMYFLGIVLLIYAIFLGIRVNGSLRWIRIGGFEFQHFEVVKLGIVMFVSLILAKAQQKEGTVLSLDSACSMFFIRPGDVGKGGDYTMLTILITALIPCAFIFTENLSTVVIIMAVVLMMMFIGRVNWKHLLTLLGAGIVAAFLGVALLLSLPENLKDQEPFGNKIITWKHRLVDVFKTDAPERPEDVKIKGEEQRVYSKIAIAEGGIFGKGPGNSVRRDYIPHANSDYIFAIILEELGLTGGIITIILYLTLLYRCGLIAKECDDPYAAFLSIGIGILIVIQALLHMSISVSNFVTGQPLPLVSQGGTSFLVNCMYIGIILSISRYARKTAKSKMMETSEQETALQQQ